MTCYKGKATPNTACLYKPGQTNIVSLIAKNGRLQYSNETVSNYKRRDPENKIAVVIPLDQALDQILQAETIQYITPTHEITETEFTEALHCLPPENMQIIGGVTAFRCCEYYTSNITSHYIAMGGKYYKSRRRTHRNAYDQMIEEIKCN